MDKMPRMLWEHEAPTESQMFTFMKSINSELKSFQDLYDYSVQNRLAFYDRLFSWAGLIHEGSYETVVDEHAPIDTVPVWFSGVRLNWAENILFSRLVSDQSDHRGTHGKSNEKIAVTQVREGNTGVRQVSWAQLRHNAGRLAAALKARGLLEADRVIVIGANSVETLLVFLATTWLGGIFSSISTDMGTDGILQRAIQANPKFVFFDDAAFYNGRTVDLRPKVSTVLTQLTSSTNNLLAAIITPRFDEPLDTSSIPGAETLADFLDAATTTAVPSFVRIPFHDPFLICYSSGTTGNPKAIVHSVGGVLLNLLKEGRLHESTSANSVSLQYTTTSWIMYVLQLGALLPGARVVLYDGSPLMPSLTTLLNILAEQRVTKFGTSPRWMLEMAKNKISPREAVDLSALKVVTSTGMALSDEMFEWFYDLGFPRHTQLINMSGGTDIAGCFGTGNPLTPVYVGGTQGPSLGVPVSVFNSQCEDTVGAPVPPGVAGELVVTAAFPNMPCFFWGDISASGNPTPGPKYHSSYFNRFNHVWTHGDFCMVHPMTSNIHFLGRSDGVLNPSGVRFGSSEIYTIIEAYFSSQVADSLCVGQRRPGDADEKVLLFLLMRKGQRLTRGLIKQIQFTIAKGLSKRHVPKYIFEVPEIPMTVNGKKVEVPVKQIVSGHTVKPSASMMNPQSLEFYYKFVHVEELERALEKL
ncbi:acetoacetyl-CoA synthase [Aspergillus pseudoustus]|uniref:Acetoacetyl-CoA synthase n=1 Tax=Aspergillus pseudoustus TaxID=1810923 RepID=A0ABR4KI42_9EURO